MQVNRTRYTAGNICLLIVGTLSSFYVSAFCALGVFKFRFTHLTESGVAATCGLVAWYLPVFALPVFLLSWFDYRIGWISMWTMTLLLVVFAALGGLIGLYVLPAFLMTVASAMSSLVGVRSRLSS